MRLDVRTAHERASFGPRQALFKDLQLQPVARTLHVWQLHGPARPTETRTEVGVRREAARGELNKIVEHAGPVLRHEVGLVQGDAQEPRHPLRLLRCGVGHGHVWGWG